MTEPENRPDRRRKLRPAGWVAVITVALIAAASAMYAAGADPVVTALDAFWRFFDESIERLRVLGGLVPLAIAFVAYKVYRSEQWWKRAEWALDAASENKPEVRRTFGNRTIDQLLTSRLAPTQDFTMFRVVVADRYGSLLREEIGEDPAVAAVPDEAEDTVDPGVDSTGKEGGQ
ncbi:hypothetical protein GCM10011374_35510 [Kocuria dechangensis]|uniref:Uncharacterized protein n=1 Tax=Kocuria dechangensis TaxID=1176249 RepID=A0A917H5I1_9MICC|nr:hypothetical protein [Kocuria dechangensis]GGG68108.1 hypothetical protein GCM10011374_35510 [Kocuria dechangensis]